MAAQQAKKHVRLLSIPDTPPAWLYHEGYHDLKRLQRHFDGSARAAQPTGSRVVRSLCVAGATAVRGLFQLD